LWWTKLVELTILYVPAAPSRFFFHGRLSGRTQLGMSVSQPSLHAVTLRSDRIAADEDAGIERRIAMFSVGTSMSTKVDGVASCQLRLTA
jgi:hypothetical protein